MIAQEIEDSLASAASFEFITEHVGAGPANPVAGTLRADRKPFDDELKRIAAGLKGADDGTNCVMRSMRDKGLPLAAFHRALEAVEEARARHEITSSEARYYVGTLKKMLEGQYSR